MAWDSDEPGLLGRALPLADDAALKAALEAANLQTRLMVYVQLTRDEAMLDRFAPHIRTAYAKDPTDIPEALAQDLRESLRRVLTTPGAAATGELPAALMQRMMSVGVGEPVADEFIPLLFDQIGFKRPLPRRDIPGRARPPAGFKVLVIGAGMVGLAAAVKLGEAGYDYTVIEKNPEVGGTWWENRYPGVGVDTPSHFYSYSFEISPDWNHYHPHGGDMQRYLVEVADKYRLRERIRFETTALRLTYDAAAKAWEVVVRKPDGAEETLRATAVIVAHGPVNRWKWPAIPGRESFAGSLMHTAGWDASRPSPARLAPWWSSSVPNIG
jgi:4-hydroxyacetophenone monooxygenase